jgi:hypothetical protein
VRAPIDRPSLLWRAFVVVGVGSLTVLSTSDKAWDAFEENVTDALPRSAVQNLLTGTVALHLAEAILARRWARRGGLDHVGAWSRTTLVYGFPELGRIRRRVASVRTA